MIRQKIAVLILGLVVGLFVRSTMSEAETPSLASLSGDIVSRPRWKLLDDNWYLGVCYLVIPAPGNGNQSCPDATPAGKSIPISDWCDEVTTDGNAKEVPIDRIFLVKAWIGCS